MYHLTCQIFLSVRNILKILCIQLYFWMCFLFHCEFRHSWFFVCWLALDWVLDILNIVLWDPGSHFNSNKNVDFVVVVTLVLVGSHPNCWPAFSGFWFNRIVFTMFSVLPRSVPRLWPCALFSEPVVCPLGSCPGGRCAQVHTQLWEITLLLSVLSAMLPTLLVL